MLGNIDKVQVGCSKLNRRNKFTVFHIVSLLSGVHQQLGLGGRELDLVLGAVVHGKIQEVLESVEVVGAKSRVISLAHSSNMEVSTTNRRTKTRILGFS